MLLAFPLFFNLTGWLDHCWSSRKLILGLKGKTKMTNEELKERIELLETVKQLESEVDLSDDIDVESYVANLVAIQRFHEEFPLTDEQIKEVQDHLDNLREVKELSEEVM